MTTIDDLFHVKSGKGDYRKNLDKGNTPLISATAKNNGVWDFVDMEPIFQAPCITVERVGGNAFVQLKNFVTVPDDISILIPKEEMSIKKLYYISAQINFSKWKFNYSRKLTPTRLKEIEIDLSNFNDDDLDISQFFPEKQTSESLTNPHDYKLCDITKLFHIDRVYAPYMNELESDFGDTPYISTTEYNNGITMKCDSEPIFGKYSITVSLDGKCGIAFFQFEDYIAGEKTAVLTPKFQFNLFLMFYLILMIRKESWRYHYGRKLSITRLKKFKLAVPITEENEIDLIFVEKLVKNCYGWGSIESQINV